MGALLGLLPAEAQIPSREATARSPLLGHRPPFGPAAAEKEKKPVVVDFGIDWNISSKRFDNETFADEKVQAQLQGCVLVRINPEASADLRKLADQYGVHAYPTIAILNYQGRP